MMTAAPVGRLATVGADGAPHLVPIVFVVAGDHIYWSVDEKPKRTTELRRLRNIRAEPRVAILVDHYEDDWSRLWWVRADGRARILTPGDEQTRALELLATKYRHYREVPPPGPVIAVDVGRWSTWAAG